MRKVLFEYLTIVAFAILIDFFIVKGFEFLNKSTQIEEGNFSRYIGDIPRVVYSRSWCPKCKNTVKVFAKKNILFEDRYIERSSRWKSDFIALKASRIPVILKSDRIVFGYNLELFDKYIVNKQSNME